MAKSVKLADIAEILNVSTVTVSKALADQKGVSQQMREKIKKLAREMGYQSPSEAKMSRAGRSYNIGVLIAQRCFEQQNSFYWQVYQQVATGAVARECFTMLEIIGQESERKLEMPRLLAEDKADGVIMIGLLREDYLSMVAQKIRVPFVCLDFYDKKIECDAVIADNFYGMYRLTDYLVSMGHTRVGYVGTLFSTCSITDRYFGFCKALLENGLEVRQEWVIDDRDRESGMRDEGFCFRLPEEMPTAFVCNCDLTAGVFIEVLRERGYGVPEDISVAGFDNYIYPGICDLGITTYEVDSEGMAWEAISKLIGKIEGKSYKKGVSIVEGHLVIKDSVRRMV